MKKRKRHFNHVLNYLFLCTLFFLGVIRFGLYHIETHYADKVDLITNFPTSSQVYDRHGTLLYEYFGEIRRIPVSDEEIPEHLIHATLMAEDERFFDHPGFDPLGIARAFWRNWRAKTVVEGGSTLGQQLVKNTILGPSEGYQDKLEEVFLSIAIDAKYSKHRILYLYLNTIPYGSNVYGAESASRFYFDKHAKDLTVSEAAILAALPKHPTYLSPYGDHVDELKERRDWIISKMHEKGYLNEREYTEAMNTKILFASPEMDIRAPHFVLNIKSELEQILGKERLEQGGLMITTTLDIGLQEAGEEILLDYQDLRDKYNADSSGILALDPRSGEILAMVGNVDYFNEKDAGNVNMTIANRQPGSAFKPLVYAALLDQKSYTPASILWDKPTNFSLGREPYIPKNYDLKYRGPVHMRDALAQSLNVPAVQALMEVGIDKALDFAEDLGITTLDERERFGPSLVLGGAEVTLLDLVSAYGTFANSGAQLPPKSILRIETIDGEEIYWRQSAPKQIMHQETAYQITSMLSDNKARTPVFGPNSSLAFDEHQVAAKTGTTQAYRDAWTVGYTPTIAVGVWVGNHDNHAMKYGAAGALAASPVWRAFMDEYLSGRPTVDFALPDKLEKQKVYTVLGPVEEYVASWQIDPREQSLARKSFLYRRTQDKDDSRISG